MLSTPLGRLLEWLSSPAKPQGGFPFPCFAHKETSLIPEFTVFPLYFPVGSISRQSIGARAGVGSLALFPDLVTVENKGLGTCEMTVL